MEAVWWRWGGVLAGLAAGGSAAASGAFGRGVLLAAPVFGLCVLAGVVGGEISIRPPGGAVRAAVLEVRQVRDYLPAGLAWATVAAGLALTAVMGVTTAVASPGRGLTLACGPGVSQTSGPWPGPFYTLPLAVLVAGGLLLGGAALRVVVGRARTGTGPDAVSADDASRQRAARTIISACGILVTVPLAGLCLVSAGAVLSFSCRPGLLTAAGWALVAGAALAAALFSWFAAVLLAPAR